MAREAMALPQFAALRSSFKGELIFPSDAQYERARRGASFNPTTDSHPALIARCNDAGDVARALEFAALAKLEIAVKAGGHDVLGASVRTNGIVIDVSGMKRVEIDAKTRIARVGAGVRSGELNLATAPYGLAPVLGCNPAVGISGLTLGGGLGWFLGTHGAACDHLVGADIVTADGKLRRATADENAELFWGIRGGGGNFGVVTSLDLSLISQDQVLGGAIAFRADTASFLRFYRDFMHSAPDALAVELNLFSIGQPVILALVCWSGDQAEGERVLRPLRTFATPLFDSIRSVSYAHLTDSPDGGGPKVENLFWRGASLDDLSDSAIERISNIVKSAPPGWSIGLGHFMHGEVCRLAKGATPLVRTPGQFTYFIGTGWNDAAQAASCMEWVIESMADMRSASSAATYVNYLSDDSPNAIATSYGPNYARLRTLKRRYDPGNTFHHNRNIRP